MKPSAKLTALLDGVVDYAHRGCWERRVPENSKTAFWRATEKGLGIELDVHLTADGHVIVFHDYNTWRMCGVKGVVEEMDLSELKVLRLKGRNEEIPTLSEVLEIVGGKVPLLIELKCRNNEIALCDALIELLNSYSGKYMFIGFNEKAAKYFKDKGYTIALSCFKPKSPTEDFVPDALLCHIWGIPRSAEKLAGYPPFISWTVSSNYMRRKSQKTAIATIYNTKHFDF